MNGFDDAIVALYTDDPLTGLGERRNIIDLGDKAIDVKSWASFMRRTSAYRALSDTASEDDLQDTVDKMSNNKRGETDLCMEPVVCVFSGIIMRRCDVQGSPHQGVGYCAQVISVIQKMVVLPQ